MPSANPVCIASFLGLSGRDVAAETRARQGVLADAEEFKVTIYGGQLDLYTNFIAYGVSRETRQLGERERRALVRDVLQTIGYRATPEDFHRLTTGQRPRTRNMNGERVQLALVRDTFRTMYRRDPNFRNPQDDAAWNVLMYRVRFPRDLVQEREGILRYKKIYKRLPTSPLSWAAVRALGYIR